MKFWQFKGLCSTDRGVKLIVTSGRNEGQTLEFEFTSNSRIIGKLEDGSDIEIPYAKVEFIDSEGHPKYEPVTDMTGREIFPDSIICYSVTEGRTHALEIGRVTSITDTGYIKTKVMVQDGDKVLEDGRGAKHGGWHTRERTLQAPNKILKLPADTDMVMMWIMNEFEDFGK